MCVFYSSIFELEEEEAGTGLTPVAVEIVVVVVVTDIACLVVEEEEEGSLLSHASPLTFPLVRVLWLIWTFICDGFSSSKVEGPPR